MTGTNASPTRGKSPFFYGGVMFAAYGLIAALTMTDTVQNPAIVMLLMIAPVGLIIPLMRAANRRVDDGRAAGSRKGAAQKRYIQRVMVFTSLYMVAMAFFVLIENGGEVAQSLRIGTALLPGLAIIGVFWAIGRLIVEEQDEFIRMLVIRQSLVATAFALSAASIWGFLEAADVVPHGDAYWVAIAWFFGLAVGSIVNRIQYGTWGAV